MKVLQVLICRISTVVRSERFLTESATLPFLSWSSLTSWSLIWRMPAASPAQMLWSNLKNPAFIAANAPKRVAIDEVFSVPMAASMAWWTSRRTFVRSSRSRFISTLSPLIYFVTSAYSIPGLRLLNSCAGEFTTEAQRTQRTETKRANRTNCLFRLDFIFFAFLSDLCVSVVNSFYNNEEDANQRKSHSAKRQTGQS